MTKAAFASGLDTKGHCDVQDWSPHIWEMSESKFHKWEVWGLPGLSSPEGYHERIDQLFVWFCSFAMSVFPILPWFVSTLCLIYLVFFCDLMCLCLKFFLCFFFFVCVCIFDLHAPVMSVCYVLQRRCEKWCATVMRDYYCVIVTKLGIFFFLLLLTLLV